MNYFHIRVSVYLVSKNHDYLEYFIKCYLERVICPFSFPFTIANFSVNSLNTTSFIKLNLNLKVLSTHVDVS